MKCSTFHGITTTFIVSLNSSISEFNYDEYTTRWLTLLTTMNYALTFFRNYLEFKLLWILIMSFWRLKNFSKWLLTFFFHFNRIQFELFKSIAIKWYRLQGIILFYLFISNNFFYLSRLHFAKKRRKTDLILFLDYFVMKRNLI